MWGSAMRCLSRTVLLARRIVAGPEARPDRVHGPWDSADGMRFDPTRLLLAPYGRSVIVPKKYSRDAGSIGVTRVGCASSSRSRNLAFGTTGRPGPGRTT